MRFKSLYLISEQEKAAISIRFDQETTIIQAGNGRGKSALLKSLYDTLGATPHKIDSDWKKANVASLLEFEVDSEIYFGFKYAGIYSIFDSNYKRLIQTSSIMTDLAPFMAQLLHFKLLMTGRKENVVIPPPAYAFAPFYLDQDKSWNAAWDSFTKMYLEGSKKTLAEYHTGLKPNAYYEAKAARDQLKVDIKKVEVQKKGISEALKELRELNGSTGLYFSLDDFERETSELLEESRKLYIAQSKHRELLGQLYERKSLWETQVSITKFSLAETEDAFKTSIDLPNSVDCPTCGEGYENDIKSRFNIAADAASLVGALKEAEIAAVKLDDEIRVAKLELEDIQISLEKIDVILGKTENQISLADVIDIQGRNSATRALRSKVDEYDLRLVRIEKKVEEYDQAMRATQDKKRTKEIKDFFGAKLVANSIILDTKAGEAKDRKITSAGYSRGSKGPRGLAAYYYAILETTKAFGSSAFCPIVIDAPNQQGQDAEHLPVVIKFLVNNRPSESQLILAVEDTQGFVSSNENCISVVNLRSEKDQVLLKQQYEAVSKVVAPFYAKML
ncbi:MAG: hypothetical protein AB8B86_02780 [Pseudomonadales bacterium]